jgi:ACS family tartrate transporter-like MFS transporter
MRCTSVPGQHWRRPGVLCIIIAGWNSDRSGDRLRDAFVLAVVLAAALLLLGVASTPALVVVGYLLFSATFFTAGALVVSSWADLLHVRQLAVGSAAINTLWQIGAFLSPYAWGVAKDATGSFRAGLMGASVLAVGEALAILYLRRRVLSERRQRAWHWSSRFRFRCDTPGRSEDRPLHARAA